MTPESLDLRQLEDLMDHAENLKVPAEEIERRVKELIEELLSDSRPQP